MSRSRSAHVRKLPASHYPERKREMASEVCTTILGEGGLTGEKVSLISRAPAACKHRRPRSTPRAASFARTTAAMRPEIPTHPRPTVPGATHNRTYSRPSARASHCGPPTRHPCLPRLKSARRQRNRSLAASREPWRPGASPSRHTRERSTGKGGPPIISRTPIPDLLGLLGC